MTEAGSGQNVVSPPLKERNKRGLRGNEWKKRRFVILTPRSLIRFC